MAPEGGGDRDRGGKEAARVERSAGWWRSLRGVPSRAPSLAVETAAAAVAAAAAVVVAAAAAARTATAAAPNPAPRRTPHRRRRGARSSRARLFHAPPSPVLAASFRGRGLRGPRESPRMKGPGHHVRDPRLGESCLSSL